MVVAGSPDADEDQAFVDALSDEDGD